MKKFLPQIIMCVVIIVAIIIVNQMTTLRQVGADGKPLADGNSYKNKFGYPRKKKITEPPVLSVK